MKKILSLILCLSLAFMAYGQDTRNRTVETIVADVLAQMPAQNAGDFNNDFIDLAKSAPQSVEILASMFEPASKGKNNKLEYAISGLIDFVNTPANAAYIPNVNKGLVNAISNCKDEVNKAFFLRQLRTIVMDNNEALLRDCFKDQTLASPAIAAISNLKNADDVVMDLVKNANENQGLLADYVAQKGLKIAEPYLLDWAKGGKLGKANSVAVYSALASIGSAASLDILKQNSIEDYANLLSNLNGKLDKKAALNGAKYLMGTGQSNFMIDAARLMMDNQSMSKGLKLFKNSLQSDNRVYRNAVLAYATSKYGKSIIEPILMKNFSKIGNVAKEDVLNWIGVNKSKKLQGLVLSSIASNGNVGKAAMRSASLLGGQAMGAALIKQLGGENSNAAMAALKSIKGVDFAKLIGPALAANSGNKSELLKLASYKKMSQFAPVAFGLLNDSKDSQVAVEALSGLVTTENIPQLGKLLAVAKGSQVKPLQSALIQAIRNMAPESQYKTVKGLMAGANADNFYPVLASTNTDEAVKDLLSAFQGGDESAFQSLVEVNNFASAPALLEIAKTNPQLADKALTRYVNLVAANEQNLDKKRLEYADALKYAQSAKMKNQILGAVAAVPTMKAFLLASQYLDSKGSEYAAAEAVKNIASKTKEEIDYAALKSNLEKAIKIYAATGRTDDGYSIDQINKILSETEPSPISELTPEEKKQGFEMLFDGTDLSKWQGDFEGYTPVNGAINVSANYGATGNLYTKKEYRNFVLRFEFCFLKPAVNNGVGVRTPMGVDAAYHGMCEVQILDHDDPVYKDLNDYQVHGSVYGVIPAKRIVHKPLGQWETEEIRVEGDHIKVTVNGEVIVDGNIRKACKGHNVAPDGGKRNPYTVDHKNHPGMFNEKGYVSFCGHGSGLKIRNVRILDLGNKK